MRTVGPLLPENRIGRANLTAAFPEKSPAEIDTILRGVWDNLGRIAAEFAHLDRLCGFRSLASGAADPHRSETGGPRSFFQTAGDGQSRRSYLAAHFANWELPAVCAAACKLDTAVLYRRPNNPAIDKWLHETRAAAMGTLIPTSLDAPMKLAEALERGTHVGMLVDQYYSRGVDVTFFGRRTKANPLLARLARHFDCPIHGTARRTSAGPSFSRRADRASTARPRCRRQGRYRRDNAGHHVSGRRLDARISGAVAVAAPALAAGGSGAGQRPVLILVHSRLISRCVFWSRAAHRVETAHGGRVRIDALVVEYRLVDEFLACEIAVGIGDKIAVLSPQLPA